MDLAIFKIIHSLAGQSALLDNIGIFFANYFIYLIVAAGIFFVLKRKDNREKTFVFIWTALTMIVSRGLFTEIIRFLYVRQRPFEVLGFTPLFDKFETAFPSGHAAFLFALAFSIFYFNRKWGWWLLGVSLLNGLARVFVGIHWPGDILGGIIVAFIAFLIVKYLIKNYRPKEKT